MRVVRQHDANGRFVTVERIDRLRRWLDDLETELTSDYRPGRGSWGGVLQMKEAAN